MSGSIRWTRLSSIAAGVALVASAGLPGTLAHAGTPTAGPSITRVSFSGTATSPVITITGKALGAKPKPDPNLSPAKAGKKYGAACNKQPLQGNGKDGFDFGATALGVGWGTTAPTGYSAGTYVAGEYLDCIGLVISSYSSTKIVLHPGCQYALYSQLAAGDKFLVQVKGVTKSGTVTYAK
jgi:hypothetical protein